MRARPVVATIAGLLLLAAACGDDDAEGGSDRGPEAAADADYVAIGDSYAAGGGAPPYDVPPRACARSSQGYPYVVAEATGRSEAGVDLHACGGARIDDLVRSGTPPKDLVRIPDRPDEDVQLVTFSIGGNDTVVYSAIPVCTRADCSAAASNPRVVEALPAIAERLVEEVYPALRRAYPEAELVHVGYPRLTPVVAAEPGACPWLTAGTRTGLAALHDAFNDTVRDAAARSEDDITFVDVSDAFAGHELCTFDSWVRPIGSGAEALHPTAAGYEAIGTAVVEALGDEPSTGGDAG